MPTFFEIALDYLPIQASSVPSKCVFSSSTEMDTKKQNHINPELMEALQMLKFALLSSNLVSTSLNIGSHWSQCCENRILSLIGISLLIFLGLTPRTLLIELYRRMVMTMMIQPEQNFLYYVHFFRTLSGLLCFCTHMYLVTLSFASQSSVSHPNMHFCANFTLNEEISIPNREPSMASATTGTFQLFPQPPTFIQLAHASAT